MDKAISNSIYHNRFHAQRWIRVINDQNGEYYDMPIASGTNNEQREFIADNIELFACEEPFSIGSALIKPEPFQWTRYILYSRKGGEFYSDNEEAGICVHRGKADKAITYYNVDENMDIIPGTERVVGYNVVGA